MTAAEIATAASVAALILAVLSLYVSLSQRTLSSKALRLALAQEERRNASLDLRIVEATSVRRPEGRWLLMDIVATNPTDVDTSLVAATLRVTYKLDTRGTTALILDHDWRDGAPVPSEQSLELPGRLQANGAARGVLVFFLPAGLLTSDAIDELELSLGDARGAVATHDIWAPREVTNGPE